MQLTDSDIDGYNRIRSGGAGFIELPRGLIAVWGKEAVQFLDGMITNDMKTLADGAQMLAAFPNAQGRLLAVVRVMRQGERFLIETEDATREKLYQSLFRFTFAGDFFVEDLSDGHAYFEIFGPGVPDAAAIEKFSELQGFRSPAGASYFITRADADRFREFLAVDNKCVPISDSLYETLRIESGIPKYGVDMDETTIVPELGLDGMISYTKGCYVGQEIIARIHFRGHVAKQLAGLAAVPASSLGLVPGAEITSPAGKNAGRVTSAAYSPKLDRTVALGFVRYEFLTEGTELMAGDVTATVHNLPFVEAIS